MVNFVGISQLAKTMDEAFTIPPRNVKMLLAAIAQIMLWIIGVIGHSQNYQRVFQANTVKDKKVFSYFYLGQRMMIKKLLLVLLVPSM